jgi:hypothetical protein
MSPHVAGSPLRSPPRLLPGSTRLRRRWGTLPLRRLRLRAVCWHRSPPPEVLALWPRLKAPGPLLCASWTSTQNWPQWERMPSVTAQAVACRMVVVTSPPVSRTAAIGLDGDVPGSDNRPDPGAGLGRPGSQPDAVRAQFGRAGRHHTVHRVPLRAGLEQPRRAGGTLHDCSRGRPSGAVKRPDADCITNAAASCSSKHPSGGGYRRLLSGDLRGESRARQGRLCWRRPAPRPSQAKAGHPPQTRTSKPGGTHHFAVSRSRLNAGAGGAVAGQAGAGAAARSRAAATYARYRLVSSPASGSPLHGHHEGTV